MACGIACLWVAVALSAARPVATAVNQEAIPGSSLAELESDIKAAYEKAASAVIWIGQDEEHYEMTGVG